MPSLSLTFPHDLNVSVQVGDIMYTSLTINSQSGVNQPLVAGSSTKPFPIGQVTTVDHATKTIVIDTTAYLPTPTITSAHYLFFSKDPVVNTSGIIGYYAETEYRNYSSVEAEIFATAIDYVESSK
tara:strand:- start:213 stop:590 length:378 start_codon:yes stop_codon:yes gene_type:complete